MAVAPPRYPDWLPRFVSRDIGEFIALCTILDHAHKKMQKFYCVKCDEGPFCEKEKDDSHSSTDPDHEHLVLQVSKQAQNFQLLVKDVEHLLDLDDIKLYTNNKKSDEKDRVMVYVRPKQPGVLQRSISCKGCGQTFSDASRFCSLTCKMNYIDANPGCPETLYRPQV